MLGAIDNIESTVLTILLTGLLIIMICSRFRVGWDFVRRRRYVAKMRNTRHEISHGNAIYSHGANIYFISRLWRYLWRLISETDADFDACSCIAFYNFYQKIGNYTRTLQKTCVFTRAIYTVILLKLLSLFFFSLNSLFDLTSFISM